MNLEISEINIIPVKPKEGLLGFASCVLNQSLYLGGIAIRTDLSNKGYRLVFPTKKFSNGKEISLFHPINRQFGKFIADKILCEWEKVTNHGQTTRRNIA